MGYNGEHAQTVAGRPWICVDIETSPMPDCAQYLTDAIEAPSTWKDPAKIAQYIEEKRAKQIAEAGLDLDLCEIVAIGIVLAVNTYSSTREASSEAELIVWLWRLVETLQRDGGGALVGFNCLGFDLPVLLRRSLYLGIPVPPIAIDRYRHEGVIDVMDVLSFGRVEHRRSLAFYCRRFGIPHDDRVDGSQIAGLVAAGDWAAVEGHVRADVTATAALAARCGLIYAPTLEPEATCTEG